jgi:hypothetical protein
MAERMNSYGVSYQADESSGGGGGSGESAPTPPQTTETGKCTEWAAWHDRMPGGPATLHVTGKCTFPKAGYVVTLRRHVPPGLNQTILLLDKEVTPPEGAVAQVETTVEVHYREETDEKFKQVTILPDNVTVDVQEVS